MLSNLIPARYYNSPEIKQIFDAFDPLLEDAFAAVQDFLAQLRVDTATWGLAYYERDYGVTTNASETYAERRSLIKSRMRGSGPSTPALLESIAEAYANGTVEVDDLSELWTIVVTFVDTIGVPSNMDDLKTALAAARPAHMVLEYVIKYNLWGTLSSKTWGELSGKTWAQVREEALD